MVTIARILFGAFGLPVPHPPPAPPAPPERFPALFPAAVDPVRLAVGGTITATPER